MGSNSPNLISNTWLGSMLPAAEKLFKAEFLEYLQALKLSVDIDAVREGEVIFPDGTHRSRHGPHS